MRNFTAIFTVFYPNVEPYIPDFLNSLSKQTDRKFLLFILNDGFPNIDQYLNKLDFPVKSLKESGTPSALREKGIQWVASVGAQNIIFADADDYFASNRVELSKKMLADYDIVFNEILLIGEKILQPISMFGKLFTDKQEITAKDVVVGNCFGLSNTAIRVDKITPLMTEMPDDIIAFDWTFFTLCLLAGAKAIFTGNTRTYYRQHGNNIASPCSFSEEQILRGVQVKRDHYQMLSKFYEEYVPMVDIFEKLLTQLQSDETLRQKYCKAVRKQATALPLWWEPIKSLKELEL